MDNMVAATKRLLELLGFRDVSVDAEPEGRKLRVFINEGEWLKNLLPKLIADVEHLVRMMSRKEVGDLIFVDINNYRKERERIIIEIAKAAARKALITKGAISLPAMNAYERRLVHTELATRPDVKTESVGEGIGRYVVVKPM